MGTGRLSKRDDAVVLQVLAKDPPPKRLCAWGSPLLHAVQAGENLVYPRAEADFGRFPLLAAAGALTSRHARRYDSSPSPHRASPTDCRSARKPLNGRVRSSLHDSPPINVCSPSVPGSPAVRAVLMRLLSRIIYPETSRRQEELRQGRRRSVFLSGRGVDVFGAEV